MRVTNVMMIENMKYNLHTNMGKLERLQYEAAQGKRFRYPSDDPIRVTRSLKYFTDISKSEQHLRNVADATSWMTTTEAAMNELRAIVHRTHELTVQAANGTNREELDKIKAEIDELKGSAIQLANSTYAGRSLFSGLQTDKPLLITEGSEEFKKLGNEFMHMLKNGVAGIIDDNKTKYESFTKLFHNVFQDHYLDAYHEKKDSLLKEYGTLLEGYQKQASKATNAAAKTQIEQLMKKAEPKNITEYQTRVQEYQNALAADPTLAADAETVKLNTEKGALETENTKNEADKTKMEEHKRALEVLVSEIKAHPGEDETKEKIEKFFTEVTSVGPPVVPADAHIDDLMKKFVDKQESLIKKQLVGIYNIDLTSKEKFEYNTGVAERVDVNTLGFSVFGSKFVDPDSPDYKKDVKQFEQPFIIGLLENISKNLTNKDQVEIKKDITRVKDVLDNVLKVTAEFGAKTNRMKLTKNKIEDSVFNLKSLMSDNEDVSLAEAMTKLLTEENVYRASLGVTGRIVQPSLMDFLR